MLYYTYFVNKNFTLQIFFFFNKENLKIFNQLLIYLQWLILLI